MKRGLFFLALLGLLSIGCTSNKASSDENASQPAAGDTGASGASSANAGNPDQDFINTAAKANRAEVELGRMVEAKAKDANVKRFAQQMVKDHTDALNQLQQIAQSKNITLAEGLPEDAQDLHSKLSSESGTQLEKDYMDAMVQDHQKDLQEFQDAAQNAKDPDVKQYASTLVPKLQEHLQNAQQVSQKLGGKAGTSTPSAGTPH